MHSYIKIVLMLSLNSFNSLAAEWSSTQISYLSGSQYRLPSDPDKNESYDIFTFENTLGHSYGDNYMFVDVLGVESEKPNLYMEVGPRFSGAKLFDHKFDKSIIKDVLLATQLNISSGNPKVYLYGPAVNLDLPGMQFFTVNLYRRDNLAIDGSTFQITIVWKANLSDKIWFGGFLDYAGAEGGDSGSKANLLTQPQFIWNFNAEFGVGIEYQYWQNKFGIENLNESLPQAMIKWTL